MHGGVQEESGQQLCLWHGEVVQRGGTCHGALVSNCLLYCRSFALFSPLLSPPLIFSPLLSSPLFSSPIFSSLSFSLFSSPFSSTPFCFTSSPPLSLSSHICLVSSFHLFLLFSPFLLSPYLFFFTSPLLFPLFFCFLLSSPLSLSCASCAGIQCCLGKARENRQMSR